MRDAQMKLLVLDCGFLFSRLDKQEKLRGRPGRGASIFEAPEVSKFFRRFSARRVSPLAGELIFVIYSASRGVLPRHSSLSRLCTP